MDYRWRCQDDQGREIPGHVSVFADQTEAEDWLRDEWAELLDGGVAQVTLVHGEAEVYGPMSLSATS